LSEEHNHVIIDADALFGSWSRHPADASLDRLLALMTRHGVERACVCSTCGVDFSCDEGNAETAAVARRYPHLIPVATADPRSFVGAREEIQRCVEEGFRIFRLFPEYQGWSPDSPAGRRLLGLIEDTGCLLILGGALPGILSVVRGLRIPVVLTGVHFYQMADLMAAVEGLPKVHLTTRFLMGPGALDTAVEVLGSQRLLFGSHAALSYMAPSLRVIEAAALTPAQRSGILGDNLQRLLGEHHANH
jgi:predicted TIM-barrel fold metal-dependent hydrolase